MLLLALQYGFELAADRGGHLHVIRAGTPPTPRWSPPNFDQRDITAAEYAALDELLAGWREKYPDVEVTTEVVADNPSRILAKASRNAQLVVVGSRGRGGFRGLLLGSVSQQLLHHSHCPVAVIREIPPATVGQAEPPDPPRETGPNQPARSGPPARRAAPQPHAPDRAAPRSLPAAGHARQSEFSHCPNAHRRRRTWLVAGSGNTHPPRSLRRLTNAIRRTLDRGGMLLIPSLAMDRAEVLLTALRELALTGLLPPVPVYVDNPMALAALDVYGEHWEGDPEIRTSVRRPSAIRSTRATCA